MARATTPLLDTDPRDRPVHRGTPVQLTDAGARVLAGRADHVQLNGVDRWIGGVHLRGRHVPWRWDDGTETLTGPPQRSGAHTAQNDENPAAT